MADTSPDVSSGTFIFYFFTVQNFFYINNKMALMLITDESSAPPDKPLPNEPPNHAELPTDTKSINYTSEQSTDNVTICEEISPSDTDNSFQTNSPSNSDA